MPDTQAPARTGLARPGLPPRAPGNLIGSLTSTDTDRGDASPALPGGAEAAPSAPVASPEAAAAPSAATARAAAPAARTSRAARKKNKEPYVQISTRMRISLRDAMDDYHFASRQSIQDILDEAVVALLRSKGIEVTGPER